MGGYEGQFFQEVHVGGKVRRSEGLGLIVEITVLELRDLGKRKLDKHITGSEKLRQERENQLRTVSGSEQNECQNNSFEAEFGDVRLEGLEEVDGQYRELAAWNFGSGTNN